MIMYWWGLSNIERPPIPSQILLTQEQKLHIWVSARETGDPKVTKMTPYGYLFYIYCEGNKINDLNSCTTKYPGLKIAAFSVREQVQDGLQNDLTNLKWKFTWMAYTIWVTRNWNIDQITATYYEASNFPSDSLH